jgi:hypothetical protein
MVMSSVASADTLTVAATTPATTASSTTTVAPDANTSSTSGATDVAQAGPLSDVPLNSWAYDAVNQLAKDGIIKGYPDGTFKGNRPMTRYEAAVLAYRAVDMLEAQITADMAAGKALSAKEKADIDAANKLMAAYGAELKAVERHVDALQAQADATDKALAATDALGRATAATVRRQQIHLNTWYRATSYGQQISANVGPLPIVFNGVTYAPGQALPSGIGSAPTGTAATGPSTTPAGIVTPGGGTAGGVAWGNQPMYVMGQNGNTLGSYGHGLGTQYLSLQFGGNPDDRSQYLVKLTNLDRYSSVNFYPQATPAVCVTPTVGVAGAACNAGNSGALDTDGILTNFVRMQDMWYQYTSPGGIYAKFGKFQQDEGPKQVTGTQWGLADYVNGIRLGYRNATFNIQGGYGFEDTSAQNNLLYSIPSSSVTTWVQADYQLSKSLDIGGYLSNYAGYHSSFYDSYAVNCVSTAAGAKTSKVIPLVAGQVYTAGGCGAGFNPIVYGAPGTAAGLPVTGAYINGTTPTTAPGAQVPNETTLGGTIVGNFGQLRLVLEGTDHLGKDPTTQAAWAGNMTGFFEADYGPFFGAPGVHGKYTLSLTGFAAGMNGLGPGFGFYASPATWTQFSTNFSDYYYLQVGVKKWITDTATFGVYAMHMGLLPNTTIQAGSASCPGCVLTGDSRNAVWGEFTLGF